MDKMLALVQRGRSYSELAKAAAEDELRAQYRELADNFFTAAAILAEGLYDLPSPPGIWLH